MKKNQKKAAQGWNLHLENSFIGLAIDSPSRICSPILVNMNLEHGVAGRFAGDVQPFEDRHAAGDQGAQGAGGAGQDAFFDQLAEDRHLHE